MLTLVWKTQDSVEDHRPTVYFLIGPPGSGKTTWRNNYLKQTTRPTLVVSADDIIERKMIYSEQDYATAFSITDHVALTAMLSEEMVAAVRQDMDIVIDRTNMNVASRKKWHDILTTNYRRIAVVFTVRPDDLSERLRQRHAATGKSIPRHIVQEMVAGYEQPTPDEFDSVLIA